MIKKDIIGDYVAVCDKCLKSEPLRFYDFREAQIYYKYHDWLLTESGKVYCPICKRSYKDV